MMQKRTKVEKLSLKLLGLRQGMGILSQYLSGLGGH